MKSLFIIAILKKLFEHGDKEKNTATDTIQYNITDGDDSKSFVFKMKDLEIDDGPVDDADIDITISDDDFISIFKGEGQLVDLLAEVKINNIVFVLNCLINNLIFF